MRELVSSFVRNFLSNRKSNDHKQEVANLLQNYCKMGVRLTLIIHFLHFQLRATLVTEKRQENDFIKILKDLGRR